LVTIARISTVAPSAPRTLDRTFGHGPPIGSSRMRDTRIFEDRDASLVQCRLQSRQVGDQQGGLSFGLAVALLSE
jgi:hypothetical protein